MKTVYKFKFPSIILLLCIVSVQSFAKQVIIKGSLKNAQVYPYVYLFKYFGSETEKIDSVKLANDAFEFKTKESMQRGFYKVGVDDKNSFTFVYDQNNLTMNGDMKAGTMTIDNSKENDLYRQYLGVNNWHSTEFKKLDDQAQQYMQLRYSDPATFQTEISKLQIQLDTLNKVLREQLNSIANNNKGTFIGKVAAMFVTYDTTTQNGFFKKDEFIDEEYTRGDMLSNKIYIFLQRYYQQGDLKVASYQVLSKFNKPNANKEVAYVSLIKGVFQQDQDYARVLTEQYAREFPASKYAKYYLSVVPKGSPKVGDTPPDIKLKDTNGKDISLYSLKGKVVLLDFWASWCGPCRKENPNVVSAYTKFKDKGFTVFSVSLDSNRDQWVAAIKKDGLLWENHVSDLKGWNSDAAKLYGVRGIPAAFLLDKTGKIVGTNLRGAELDQALEKLFTE
ncbi:MAG TPA: TlpA disulfide reductase family protein [Cytophagaceae bacterium]|jgi:peroxiredoxin|nr:TlpA disulfide reductase family protein [Cytophagaceae bacterium]